MLGIKMNLCTRFLPKTDGQSEITYKEMKKHLYIFVNYQENNQLLKLAMAEFTANNIENFY